METSQDLHRLRRKARIKLYCSQLHAANNFLNKHQFPTEKRKECRRLLYDLNERITRVEQMIRRHEVKKETDDEISSCMIEAFKKLLESETSLSIEKKKDFLQMFSDVFVKVGACILRMQSSDLEEIYKMLLDRPAAFIAPLVRQEILNSRHEAYIQLIHSSIVMVRCLLMKSIGVTLYKTENYDKLEDYENAVKIAKINFNSSNNEKNLRAHLDELSKQIILSFNEILTAATNFSREQKSSLAIIFHDNVSDGRLRVGNMEKGYSDLTRFECAMQQLEMLFTTKLTEFISINRQVVKKISSVDKVQQNNKRYSASQRAEKENEREVDMSEDLAASRFSAQVYLFYAQLNVASDFLGEHAFPAESQKEFRYLLDEQEKRITQFLDKMIGQNAKLAYGPTDVDKNGFQILKSISNSFTKILNDETSLSLKKKEDLQRIFFDTSREIWKRIQRMDSTEWIAINKMIENLSVVFIAVLTQEKESKRVLTRSLSPRFFGEPEDYHFKIAVLGEDRVGKSSIISRYVDDTFAQYRVIGGDDYKVRNLRVESKHIKLTIWDTRSEFELKNADAIIFVCDLSNRVSFKKLIFKTTGSGDCTKMILGNKSDLQRTVSEQELEKFASQNRCLSAIVSAKTGENIENAFKELITAKLISILAIPFKGIIRKPDVEENEEPSKKDEARCLMA